MEQIQIILSFFLSAIAPGLLFGLLMLPLAFKGIELTRKRKVWWVISTIIIWIVTLVIFSTITNGGDYVNESLGSYIATSIIASMLVISAIRINIARINFMQSILIVAVSGLVGFILYKTNIEISLGNINKRIIHSINYFLNTYVLNILPWQALIGLTIRKVIKHNLKKGVLEIKTRGHTKKVILFIAVVILIIFLSIMLLQSNSPKRSKDAAILAQMSSVRAQAEIIYNRDSSYENVCNDTQIKALLDASSQEGAGNTTSDICNDSPEAYAASSPLKTSENTWCIDSTGISGMLISPKTLGTKTKCQPEPINY